jgi:hypothetical protein
MANSFPSVFLFTKYVTPSFPALPICFIIKYLESFSSFFSFDDGDIDYTSDLMSSFFFSIDFADKEDLPSSFFSADFVDEEDLPSSFFSDDFVDEEDLPSSFFSDDFVDEEERMSSFFSDDFVDEEDRPSSFFSADFVDEDEEEDLDFFKDEQSFFSDVNSFPMFS